LRCQSTREIFHIINKGIHILHDIR
jgi:hypothetical protein